MSKLEEAKEAINAVFNDISVSPGTTFNSLLALQEEVNNLIDILENDGVEPEDEEDPFYT